jgi:hypothetical protein
MCRSGKDLDACREDLDAWHEQTDTTSGSGACTRRTFPRANRRVFLLRCGVQPFANEETNPSHTENSGHAVLSGGQMHTLLPPFTGVPRSRTDGTEAKPPKSYQPLRRWHWADFRGRWASSGFQDDDLPP